jgi:hypothetical protein
MPPKNGGVRKANWPYIMPNLNIEQYLTPISNDR